MKRICLLVSVLLSVMTMRSQTLDECRQMAREHYPEIQQYDLIDKTEQYNLSNAARAWIPQVVISGQATYQTATPTYPEVFNEMIEANGVKMSGIRNDQYKVAIDVSQNIWDGGKSKADSQIAQADASEQRSRVDVALYDVQMRVDNLYFGILLLDERVTQMHTLIDVLQNNLKRIKVYHKNGVAMQSDVDVLEAELLTAHQSLVQIEASRQSYRSMLEIFIGQTLRDDKLTRPEMTNVVNREVARPELAMFDAQSHKLDAQRSAINASLMPRFSAFAQGYYGYPGMDMFKSMVDSHWTLNAMVGVRMSWNIGAFYTKTNNLNKLDVAQQHIEVEREKFIFNTNLMTTQIDDEISRLRKTLEDDNRIVELRSSVRKAAESKMENGVIDTTDLLLKIADETTAKINRSTHEIEILQSIYKLKTTLNQ